MYSARSNPCGMAMNSLSNAPQTLHTQPVAKEIRPQIEFCTEFLDFGSFLYNFLEGTKDSIMSNNPFLTADYRSTDLAEEEALQLSEARASFTKLVSQAEKQQRSVIMKHGRPVAAIVPLADLERLRDLDLERRKKMVFREPQDKEMTDFVGEESETAVALHKETVAALAAAITDMVAKDKNLLNLLSKDLLAQGSLNTEDRESDLFAHADERRVMGR